MSWKLSKSENDTSVTLDFLRALAAFAVFFGHAIDFMGVGFAIKPPNAPYMQNFGVLIFFTLSGFLIAYTLNRSESSGESFASYLINRVARIYSGFLPCFVFIIVFSLILVNLNLHPIPEQVNWFVAIVNLLMLNGPPLSTLMPQIGVPFGFPNYPLAGQLWTLPAEFHLYIFVGGLYYFFKRGGLFALVLADFSFSLYLIHYPILYIINLNTEIRGWSGLLISGLLIVALAIILSHIGERHHKRLAKVIKQSFKIV